MLLAPQFALAAQSVTELDGSSLVAIAALWAAAGVGAWLLLDRWSKRDATRRRVHQRDAAEPEPETDEERGGLARWLFLAGFRRRGAVAAFVLGTLACALLGISVAVGIARGGWLAASAASVAELPGGIGELAALVLRAAPLLLVVCLALLPLSIVRSTRRRRVLEVEQDLPITLELLATMSEAGLAFDGALTKALEAQPEKRPLAEELRTFQTEALAGVQRVRCFRRLARRLEVPSVTIFTSALVQAEQVGAGFAGVLRIQADDLRNRRREKANAMAQAMPVKLMFPLVLCFLPGIFVTTLGPTFMQFIELAESMSGR